ncbi:MAG: alpha/beta fold hydrolase [Roseobacter sp.]
MSFFFSRRTYNASKNRFTNNVAEVTRYLALQGDGPENGKWRGSMMEQVDWCRAVHQDARSNEITIFVHGFNTPQTSMLTRRAKIESGLRKHGYGGAVVAFDWPSDGSALRYSRDKSDAKKAARHLVSDCILPLLAEAPKPTINLIGHSMGCYVTLRALSEFDDTDAFRLNQICFVSADVHRSWMGKGAWGSLILAHRAKRFTNYFSQLDGTLNLPALLVNSFEKRVGRWGMPPLIAKNHVDIYSHEQFLKDVPHKEQTPTYSHTWWFDNDKFYQDLAMTLAGHDAHSMPTRRRMNTTDLALLS